LDSTNSQYTLASLRDDILSTYIAQHSLVHPAKRGYFVLDELLKGILLSKKDKDEEFMKREEGLKRLMAACQPWYEISTGGRGPELRSVDAN